MYGEGSPDEISARILADKTFSEEERKARQQEWLAMLRTSLPDSANNQSPTPGSHESPQGNTITGKAETGTTVVTYQNETKQPHNNK